MHRKLPPVYQEGVIQEWRKDAVFKMQDSCKNGNGVQVSILRDGVGLFIFTMRFLHWAFRLSADLIFLFFIEAWLIYSVQLCNKVTHSHTHTHTHTRTGFPGGAGGKESPCHCSGHKRFDSWVGKIPWSRE